MTWADEARAHGATPALYTVWPEEYGPALPAVIQSYRDAARASGALLLPAGDAWREAWHRIRKLRLYGADRLSSQHDRDVSRRDSDLCGADEVLAGRSPARTADPARQLRDIGRAARTLQLAAHTALARR